jgi:hypothetical protein
MILGSYAAFEHALLVAEAQDQQPKLRERERDADGIRGIGHCFLKVGWIAETRDELSCMKTERIITYLFVIVRFIERELFGNSSKSVHLTEHSPAKDALGTLKIGSAGLSSSSPQLLISLKQAGFSLSRQLPCTRFGSLVLLATSKLTSISAPSLVSRCFEEQAMGTGMFNPPAPTQRDSLTL